jgi:hypothetical protein
MPFFVRGCELPASVFCELEPDRSFASMTLAGFQINHTYTIPAGVFSSLSDSSLFSDMTPAGF